MKIEFELTKEDLNVLKAADRAFVQDIDEDYMTPESIGWRMTDELYPEQCRVYQWNKLVWLRLLETEGDGYYRITEQGRQVLYPPQPEPDELMVLRAEVARLRAALENIPYEVFGDALRDGLDSNGAWDVFVDACQLHVVQALSATTPAPTDALQTVWCNLQAGFGDDFPPAVSSQTTVFEEAADTLLYQAFHDDKKGMLQAAAAVLVSLVGLMQAAGVTFEAFAAAVEKEATDE